VAPQQPARRPQLRRGKAISVAGRLVAAGHAGEGGGAAEGVLWAGDASRTFPALSPHARQIRAISPPQPCGTALLRCQGRAAGMMGRYLVARWGSPQRAPDATSYPEARDFGSTGRGTFKACRSRRQGGFSPRSFRATPAGATVSGGTCADRRSSLRLGARSRLRRRAWCARPTATITARTCCAKIMPSTTTRIPGRRIASAGLEPQPRPCVRDRGL
jgi:hypothetical protein